MKNFILLTTAALATTMLAGATNLTFNCSAYPVTFNAGAGSAMVSCPGLSGVTATGLTGVTLTYQIDYQFGGLTGTNAVKETFTPATFSGVTWGFPTASVTETGGFNSGGIGPVTTNAISGLSLANFSSAFNVAVSSSVTSGTVATSSAGIQVTYNYTNTPEPATFSLIGLGLIGAFVARRRSA